MNKSILRAACILAALAGSSVSQAQTPAPAPAPALTIKTRLSHLAGTNHVLVVSYLPLEIVSITCEKWTMLGVGSYKKQNEFTIPAGPSVAIMDAKGFDGYCMDAQSIKAHTDAGDFTGVLDRGPGNWNNSTQLTFRP